MFFKKITIVLPVFNGAAYLKEAIDSVLSQSFKDFELIIVDDCSTDDSSEISMQYAKSDPRVVYLRNDINLKLPESLNRGFTHAKGEYLTWTSCDNIYFPQALGLLMYHLDKSPEIGLVYADMEIIDEAGIVRDYVSAGSSEDLIFRNVVGACFLYRASIAKQVGLYNKKMFLCEDYEYWLRISLKTHLKPLKNCLYKYRKHSKSLSHIREKEVIARGIAVQKKYYPFFIKTRKKAALFYTHLRARDIYNPFRHFYLFRVLFFSPIIFFKEIYGLISRRFK